jgi:hypothetical protein
MFGGPLQMAVTSRETGQMGNASLMYMATGAFRLALDQSRACDKALCNIGKKKYGLNRNKSDE